LKLGKAAGYDMIEAEHLLYSHPILPTMLCTLFNSMLQLGYVPASFGLGIIIPLIKDKTGDSTNTSNYRGITLSSTISKLFEMCLIEIFGSYFTSSDLQSVFFFI
jgi:hypothetical protein